MIDPVFVQRDSGGAIVGVYTVPQLGAAEESILPTHPQVIAFRASLDVPTPDRIAPILQQTAALSTRADQGDVRAMGLQTLIDTAKTRVDNIQSALDVANARLDAANTRADNFQTAAVALAARVSTLETQRTALAARVTALEASVQAIKTQLGLP